MNEAILVLNAGSSSIKFGVFPADSRPSLDGLLCEGQCEGIGHEVRFTAQGRDGAALADERVAEGNTHADALRALLRWIGHYLKGWELVAAGHRVVHGGTRFAAPVRLDSGVLEQLHALVPLAPLHQPHNLAAIEALSRLYPSLPQVACFDTAFHQSQAPVATAYALPRRLAAQGLRRYGFHGLSYEHIAGVLPQLLGPQAAEARVVVAHLGSGASMCAMRGRRSVATTMGFTALEGLPMSRRCGSLDPGVILYLLQQMRMSPDEVAQLLYHDCGWFGVSGISDDMRALLDSGEAPAREAVDLFVYRIVRELGSLAAALGGLDALVFTAGIGEHAAPIRHGVCEGAAWLGVALDPGANERGGPCLTRPGSRVSAWVVPTHEDLMIARHAWALVRAGGPGDGRVGGA